MIDFFDTYDRAHQSAESTEPAATSTVAPISGTMNQYLVFALIGLGVGCLYAAIGVGVIVTFRGTGRDQLRDGATAMWGTYTYAELRSTGDLVIPVLGLPHRIDLGGPTTFGWPSSWVSRHVP